jgi:hypothetical protein
MRIKTLYLAVILGYGITGFVYGQRWTVGDSLLISERVRPVQGLIPTLPTTTYFYNCSTTGSKAPCDFVLVELLEREAVQQLLADMKKNILSDCGFRDVGRGKQEFICSFNTVFDNTSIAFNPLDRQTGKGGIHLGTSQFNFNYPEYWEQKLKGERITEVWIKAYARIDSNGEPVEVLNIIEPLLLKSESRYFMVERDFVKKPYLSFDEESSAFGRPVLKDLCNRTIQFSETTLRILIDKLKSPPFNGKIRNDVLKPSTETWISSRNVPSELLGRPYWEKVTYIITTERVEASNPPELRVYVRLSLLKAVNKNDEYVQATSSDMIKYENSIQDAVSQALRAACNTINGTLDNQGICTCKTK